MEIKKYMKHDALMYIIIPQRPKFLWAKHHFHEIDNYRMNLLIQRAGFKILKKKSYMIKRSLRFHLSGIRPFLWLFFDKHTIYKLINV